MNPKTILLVDDEKLLRWGLRVNLEKKGFQVVEAEGGENALELLEEGRFQILLTDYLMGGMNGDDLIVLAKQKDHNLKTIMLSGYIKEDKEDNFLNGVDFFLKKPIDFDKLVDTIDNALGAVTK